jgi:hypothetical protein
MAGTTLSEQQEQATRDAAIAKWRVRRAELAARIAGLDSSIAQLDSDNFLTRLGSRKRSEMAIADKVEIIHKAGPDKYFSIGVAPILSFAGETPAEPQSRHAVGGERQRCAAPDCTNLVEPGVGRLRGGCTARRPAKSGLPPGRHAAGGGRSDRRSGTDGEARAGSDEAGIVAETASGKGPGRTLRQICQKVRGSKPGTSGGRGWAGGSGGELAGRRPSHRAERARAGATDRSWSPDGSSLHTSRSEEMERGSARTPRRPIHNNTPEVSHNGGLDGGGR